MQCMVPGSTDKMLAQMRRGAIEYCVLALLREQDRYGLELARTLAEADGLVTSEGTVYPLLTRLRTLGLVDSEWVESDSGHPRKYYRLTDAGRSRALAMTRIWARFSASMSSLLAPLHTADRAVPAISRQPVVTEKP